MLSRVNPLSGPELTPLSAVTTHLLLMQITYDETQLPAYLENMRNDRDGAPQQPVAPAAKQRPLRNKSGKPQEYLLLFAGFGLVLLAAGMALNNVLS